MEAGPCLLLLHLLLPLDDHPCLPAPQWVQLLAAWLLARPHSWSQHHHHAWQAPGSDGVRLLLRGGDDGVGAAPLADGAVLGLVPVILPGPEGDLLLLGVARGARY